MGSNPSGIYGTVASNAFIPIPREALGFKPQPPDHNPTQKPRPRFAFLKAFLLDKDNLATIEVSPYYEEWLGSFKYCHSPRCTTCQTLLATFGMDSNLGLRLSENKEKETFEDLPLALIKERYAHLPGGQKLIDDILSSRCLNSV